jgi:hypothetical protein
VGERKLLHLAARAAAVSATAPALPYLPTSCRSLPLRR